MKQQLQAEKESFESWKQDTARQIEEDRRKELARVETRLDEIVGQIRSRAADEVRALGAEAVNRFDKKLKKARIDAGAAMALRKFECVAVYLPFGSSLPLTPITPMTKGRPGVSRSLRTSRMKCAMHSEYWS